MRVLVVGPGAMGTLFAGLLVEGGHDVWLLGRRTEVVEAIAEDGVTIEQIGRPERTIPVRATLSAADAGFVDLVLIFVKSYSTLRASQDAFPAIGKDTLVLTLQNGLNNVETIATVVGQERVIAGVTAHGATLLSPGVTRHAGVGETSIGELHGGMTPRIFQVAQALRESGIENEISPCVNCLIWGKLVVNCGINALTAILGVQNGRLIETEDLRRVMAAAALEAVAVARSAGIALPYDDPVARVEEVCRLTAANRSSMLQDVDRGVRTEVDHINGAVVREGNRLGVPTLVNWTLAQLVKSIEGK